MMEGYFCKECGAAAYVEGDCVNRTCEHKGTVIAGMTATAYGEGHMDDKPSRLSRIVDLIIKMVKQ